MSRSPRLRQIWLMAVATVAIAAAGCGSTERNPGDGPPGDVCEATADCSGAQACRSGYCTSRAAEMEGVRFQFIPPESSGYSPQTSRGVTIHADRRLDFALEPNVTVDGTIKWAANSSVPGPSGPLTFKRRGRQNTLFNRQVRVEEGDVEANILPGNYDLLFAPKDYPSRIWRNRSITAGPQYPLTLTMPAENQLVTIQGTVVFDQEGRSPSAESKKVSGAQVVAVSSDGTYTTTIDTTADGSGEETDKGRFVLRAIAPDNAEPVSYDLIINPGSETLLPKVRIPEAFEVEQDGAQKFLSEETTNLGSYPWMPSNASPATFTFRLVSDREMDWTRTQIVAEATFDESGDDGKQREFRRVTTADSEGDVELALLPAPHRISVYPPADAPLATTTFEITQPKEAVSTYSTWNTKRALRGRVVDRAGEPIEGARLAFWPQHLADKFRDRLKVSTTTDANGEFSVRLEPRPHQVSIRPPPEAGLPRHHVSLDKKWWKDESRTEWQLPEPMLLRGSVRGAATNRAMPIAGTAISASVDDDGERRLLGKATTDEEGNFYMIVPATLQQSE